MNHTKRAFSLLKILFCDRILGKACWKTKRKAKTARLRRIARFGRARNGLQSPLVSLPSRALDAEWSESMLAGATSFVRSRSQTVFKKLAYRKKNSMADQNKVRLTQLRVSKASLLHTGLRQDLGKSFHIWFMPKSIHPSPGKPIRSIEAHVSTSHLKGCL
jgi:hypothetical protein